MSVSARLHTASTSVSTTGHCNPLRPVQAYRIISSLRRRFYASDKYFEQVLADNKDRDAGDFVYIPVTSTDDNPEQHKSKSSRLRFSKSAREAPTHTNAEDVSQCLEHFKVVVRSSKGATPVMSSKPTRVPKTPSESADENVSGSKMYYSVPQATDSSKVTKFGETDEEAVTSKRRSTKTAASGSIQNAYVLQGHNGASLVDAAMERLGWAKLDKSADNWKLKWTETKGMVNYGNLKEGEQLVNHIPNCEIICNKMGLLTSLREYERVTLSVKNRPPKLLMSDFVPETFILDDKKEREMFFETFKPGDIWINKPTGLNQGKGISLIRDLDKFKAELQEKDESEKNANPIKSRKAMGRIVQRYILKPLTIKERKFDIRAYMLIASTTPYLVLFHHGYIRLSIFKYSTSDSNLCTHLTNQYIQKKDAAYEGIKNDTVWSMQQFNDYLNSLYEEGEENGGPPEKDWVFNGMERQMKAILAHLVTAVKHKFSAKLGYFELYGIDFMLDSDYKMSLIEVNTNPAMHVNCDLLQDILPPLIERTIHVALECFEKAKRRQSYFPLKSMDTFSVISSGGAGNTRVQRGASPQAYRYGNVQPRYQNTSVSPLRTLNSVSPSSEQGQSGFRALKPQNQSLNPVISASLPMYQSPQPIRKSPVHLSQTQQSNNRPFEHSLRRYEPIAWDSSNRSLTAIQIRSSADKSKDSESSGVNMNSSSSEKLSLVKSTSVDESSEVKISDNTEPAVTVMGQPKNNVHSLTSVTADSLWKPQTKSHTTLQHQDSDDSDLPKDSTEEPSSEPESPGLQRRDFRRIRTSFKRETAPISTVRVVSSNDAVRLKMSHQQVTSARAYRRRHTDRSG